MHRDYIIHTLFTPKTHFLITASRDGHIKFWKKMIEGIEFVKHYKAHMDCINGISCTSDGLKVCSIGADKSIKVYDVLTFDMINMIRLDFVPLAVTWIQSSTQLLIAVSDKDSPKICLYKYDENNKMIKELNIHIAPVNCMCYNEEKKCIISTDIDGGIEYWSVDNYSLPKNVVFKYKSETDLLSLMLSHVSITSISVSHDGNIFAVTDRDGQIRLFKYKTGKLYRQYDESLATIEASQNSGKLQFDELDFGRRQSLEKDYIKSDVSGPSNVVFDESDKIIIYPTLVGIKFINIVENKVVRTIGKVESNRFTCLSLFQGIPNINTQIRGEHESDQPSKKIPVPDPTLFCSSFKKKRFYLFTLREPADETEESEGRDVFNEKPTEDELQFLPLNSKEINKYGNRAVIHTTLGDIEIELYPRKTPKTYLFLFIIFENI